MNSRAPGTHSSLEKDEQEKLWSISCSGLTQTICCPWGDSSSEHRADDLAVGVVGQYGDDLGRCGGVDLRKEVGVLRVIVGPEGHLVGLRDGQAFVVIDDDLSPDGDLRVTMHSELATGHREPCARASAQLQGGVFTVGVRRRGKEDERRSARTAVYLGGAQIYCNIALSRGAQREALELCPLIALKLPHEDASAEVGDVGTAKAAEAYGPRPFALSAAVVAD